MSDPAGSPRAWKSKYAPQYNQMKQWVAAQGAGHNIGRLLHAREIINKGLADYWRLWSSLADWVSSALPPSVSISTLVTESAEANAWPFRHALGRDRHVVVVTDAAIARMQKLAFLLARSTQAQPQLRAANTTLETVFPPEHQAREDFDAFAEVVLQAAFVFLFNHEFAHLHNGHGGCAATTLEWYAKLQDRPKQIARTVEFDADASAFTWTLNFYARFNANPEILAQLGGTRARMMMACLSTPRSRLMMVALGAIVFHLALSSHAHARDTGHPSFRERVRLARLACRTHAAMLNVDPVVDVESAMLSAAMVFCDALQSPCDRILVGQGEHANERPYFAALRDAILADDGEDGTASDVDRHRDMAEEMAALVPHLRAQSIQSTLSRVDWWSGLEPA